MDKKISKKESLFILITGLIMLTLLFTNLFIPVVLFLFFIISYSSIRFFVEKDLIDNVKGFIVYIISFYVFSILFLTGLGIADALSENINVTSAALIFLFFSTSLRGIRLLGKLTKFDLLNKLYDILKDFTTSTCVLLSLFIFIDLFISKIGYEALNNLELLTLFGYSLIFGSILYLVEFLILKSKGFLKKRCMAFSRRIIDFFWLFSEPILKNEENTNKQEEDTGFEPSNVLSLLSRFINKVLFRYKEDDTFNDFKRYLNYEGFIIFTLQILIVIFILSRGLFIYLNNLFVGLSFDLYDFIISFIEVFNIQSFIIGFGLIFWALYSCYNYIGTKLRFPLISKESINGSTLKHHLWSFKDYILKEPIDLRNKKPKSISFKPEGDFVLYFLCKNNNSGINWIGFTNIRKDAGLVDDKNTFDVHKKRLIRKGKVSINFNNYFINSDDKDPVQIIAIRLRSNVFNEEVKLNNFSINY